MNSILSLKVQPDKYLHTFLTHNIRLDGRNLFQFRNVSIREGVVDHGCIGSSLIVADNMVFLCVINAHIRTPSSNCPSSGNVLVNVEFPRSCGIDIELFPRIAVDTNYFLNMIINNDRIFDKTQLCIIEYQAVWSLQFNVVCVKFDGNALDWSLSSIVSAINNSVLPSLKRNLNTGVWELAGENEITSLHQHSECIPSKKINLNNIPYSITFSKILNTYWIIDPTAKESSDNLVTFWKLDKTDNIYFFQRGSFSLNVNDGSFFFNDYVYNGFQAIEVTLRNAEKMKTPSNSHWNFSGSNNQLGYNNIFI